MCLTLGESSTTSTAPHVLGTEGSRAHKVHNHPCGVSDPSPEDRRATQELKRALALVDVEVLDHLIVGAEVFSFCEAGIL
jgi:DNA repair protein RadC